MNVGDRVKILDPTFSGDTGTVIETNRREQGWGFDTLVKVDDDSLSNPVPFDFVELEKVED